MIKGVALSVKIMSICNVATNNLPQWLTTMNLTPPQQIVLKRFAQTGTATVAELKKHYSYWCPPIKSLKAKGLVRFNTIRQWWELTKKGASFMPSVLEPEERKTMTKSEALELLKSKAELTEEQLDEVREALRNTEEEDVNDEDEWSSSSSNWSSSY